MEAADTPPLCHRLPGFRYIVCGRVSDHPGVALLEIARPERHNSFHEELWEEFPRALRQLDADDETRVILITGQGRNFCAGIDVGYLQRNFLSLTGGAPAAAGGGAVGGGGPGDDGRNGGGSASCPGRQRAAMRRSILALQDAYTEIERCRSPVIATVHGRCIGGGVDLITACDLRLCSADASFCVKEVDLAIAADLGTLQRLPSVVGHAAAMDLALTARVVGAQEAQRLGLVSAVVGPAAAPAAGPGAGAGGPAHGGGGGVAAVPRAALLAAALRLADTVAAKPQLAAQGTKRVLLHARDNPRVSDGLDYVATWNSAQLISADMGRVFAGAAGAGAAGAVGAGAGSIPRSRL